MESSKARIDGRWKYDSGTESPTRCGLEKKFGESIVVLNRRKEGTELIEVRFSAEECELSPVYHLVSTRTRPLPISSTSRRRKMPILLALMALCRVNS